MMLMVFRGLSLAFLALLLSGCSTIFIPYSNQMKESRNAVLDGHPDLALVAAQKNVLNDNPSLKSAEIGRIEQMMNQPNDSLKDLGLVTDHVREESLQARIRVSQMLSQAGSLLTNDNAISYAFAPYETLLLYQYQALNYFSNGDVGNAFVSIRQADLAQKWLREDQQVVSDALSRSDKESQYQIDQGKYNESFGSMDQMAEGVKSDFDNPVVDYLSALMYQSNQDYTNAIISMRHALDGSPNPQLKRKLAELLALSGNPDQATLLSKAYSLEEIPAVSPQDVTVVILSEQSLLMPREEISFPILLFPLGQIQMFSLPRYNGNIIPANPVLVKEKEQVLGQTESLFNVQAAAAHYLKEQMPMYITREVLRLVAKTAATGMANRNQRGAVIPVLGIAMQVISLVTAHADLRSWLMLPQSISLLEIHLSPGEHELILDHENRKQTVTLNAAPGSIKIIWMQDAQDFHQIQVLSVK